MTVEAVILSGRRFAERRMTSTCAIGRVTGRVFDRTTGEYVDAIDPHYSGPCKVRFERSFVHERDMEAQLVTAQQGVLFLPVDGSGTVTVDDIVIVTGSPLDSALVGRRYRVSGGFAQTYATARRLAIEEVH